VDVIFAIILVILTLKLREISIIKKFENLKEIRNENIQIAKSAFKNVFGNSNLKVLVIYRSLANHVAFFFIIALPVLSSNGMNEWL
jgi:hypothetical protein